MLQSRRRRIRGWTEEETAAFHARVDALMAEVTADEDAGRFVATEWLVGRAAEGRGSDGWCGIRTDGYSIFHNYGDCAVTWVGGPRHRYDPDVALLSRQRLPTGSFAIRVWGGVQGVLESRAIPYVLVRPPYSLGYYRTDPEGLVHGWEHSQAVVHMLQTGGFRQAA